MKTQPNVGALINAATDGDFERVRALVASGAEVNGRDSLGESVLTASIGDPYVTDASLRLAITRELLSLGADPCQLDNGRSGPLTQAMLRLDTDVLRLLLDAGARPNDEAGGHEEQTLYDWAEMDYVYEVWLMGPNGPLTGEGIPEAPDEKDQETGDVGSPGTELEFAL